MVTVNHYGVSERKRAKPQPKAKPHIHTRKQNTIKVAMNLKTVHHYNVEITPFPERKKDMVRRIFEQLLIPQLKLKAEEEHGSPIAKEAFGWYSPHHAYKHIHTQKFADVLNVLFVMFYASLRVPIGPLTEPATHT